jgi:hypothetical protein
VVLTAKTNNRFVLEPEFEFVLDTSNVVSFLLQKICDRAFDILVAAELHTCSTESGLG